ncbi:transcriptional regulator FtsR [Kribbia dieselivorans]|uniref:transcriptional regulator FtsR n=1 Tax=Kribbia dieselivorans TaxID=331526 RepID=UPI000839A12E|nr:MerR family transcriptional regulator [Kribbia dieselivorans]
MSTPGELTIGAVVDELRPDFDDVSISKIRYLEAEGLVSPRRTTAGYRLFSLDDVQRLRYILTAQRDRFLPLRVIREELDAIDRGTMTPHGGEGAAGAPQAPVSDGVPRAKDLAAPTTLRLTRHELGQRTGLTGAQLESLVGYGLIAPDGEYLDEDDLVVASAAASLIQFGIEPRHLRPFVSAADREVTLVGHAVSQRGPGRSPTASTPASGSASTSVIAAEVARQCLALHVALVRKALRQQS